MVINLCFNYFKVLRGISMSSRWSIYDCCQISFALLTLNKLSWNTTFTMRHIYMIHEQLVKYDIWYHCMRYHWRAYHGMRNDCNARQLQGVGTLKKLVFVFLSNWMGYNRGDSIPFVLNQMEFHLVRIRKECCHHHHIPFNLKGKRIRVFSAYVPTCERSAYQRTCFEGIFFHGPSLTH